MSDIVSIKKIVFEAVDKVSGTLAQITGKTNQATQVMQQFSNTVRSDTSQAALRRDTVETTAAYDKEATKIRALSGDLRKIPKDIKSTLYADAKDQKVRSFNTLWRNLPKEAKVQLLTEASTRPIVNFEKYIRTLPKDIQVRIRTKDDSPKTMSKLRRDADNTGKAFSNLKSVIGGTLIGGAIMSGVQSLGTGLWTAAKNGVALAEAGEQTKRSWQAMGLNDQEITYLSNEMVDLRNKTGFAAGSIKDIQKTFYGFTGSEGLTENLTRGVTALAVESGKGEDAAAGMTGAMRRVESSGKLTSMAFARMTATVPALPKELAKALGMTQDQLKDAVAKGTISADQFNGAIAKVGANSEQTFSDFGKTSEGVIDQLKGKWIGMQSTLGQKLLSVKGSGLQELNDFLSQSNMNKIVNELGKGLSVVGDAASKGLKWVLDHSGSIESIGSSVASITKDLLGGAWKEFGQLIGDLSGVKSGGIEGVAKGIKEIASHHEDIEKVGKAIAFYFVASKVIGFANGVWKIATGIGRIVTTPIDKILAVKSALSGDYDGESHILKAVSKHRAGGQTEEATAATDAVVPAANKGAEEAATTTGLSLGSKIVAGLGIALAAFDIGKSLFETGRSKKYQDAGSGIGTLIGTGIGVALAPYTMGLSAIIGPAVGSMAGKLGGQAAMKAVDGWNAYAAGHKPRGIIGKIGFDMHEAEHNWNNMLAGFEKKHPTISIPIKMATKKIKTGFDLVKLLGGNMKNGAKSLGDIFSDGIMGRFGKLKKDLHSDMQASAKTWSDGFKKLWDDVRGKGSTFHHEKTPRRSSSSSKSKSKATEKVPTDFTAPVSKAQATKQTAYLKGVEREISKLKSAISHAGLGKAMSAQLKDVQKSVKSVNFSKSFSSLEKSIKGLLSYLKKSKVGKTFGSEFAQIKKQITKNDPTKQLNKLNKSVKSSAKAWNSFEKPVKSFVNNMSKLQKSLKSFKKDPFGTLNKGLTKFEKTASKAKFGTQLSKQFDIANKAVGKNGFVKTFNNMTKTLNKDTQSFNRTFNKDWRNTWRNAQPVMSKSLKSVPSTFSRPVNDVLKNERSFSKWFSRDWRNTWRDANSDMSKALRPLPSTFSKRTDSVRKAQESFESGFNKSWRGWLNYIVDKFDSAFNKLPKKAESSMSKVMNAIGKGVKSLNKVIDAFGGKSLSVPSYASGTRAKSTAGHPGGWMTVNDDGSADPSEWIMNRNGSMMKFAGRNVTVPGEKGATVFNSRESRIIDRMIAPHYAEGTDNSDAMLDYVMQHSDELSKNPLPIMTKEFFANAKFTGNEFISNFGPALGKSFLKAITDPFKKMAADMNVSNPGGAGVDRWKPVIESVARRMKVDLTSGGMAAILRRIAQESNGNPDIQNNWDSNAAKGTPSVGLLQYIWPTLKSWVPAGFAADLKNGASQLAAMFNDSNWLADISVKGGWGPTGHRRMFNGGHSNHEEQVIIGDNLQHDEYVVNPYAPSAVPMMSEIMGKMYQSQPQLRINSGSADFNGRLIGLLQTVVDKLDNVDQTPVVNTDDMRQKINKRSAKAYSMMRGQ